MEKYIFTDLACEVWGENDVERERICDRVEKLLFSDASDGRKKRHMTFFTPKIWTLEDREFEMLREAIAAEIRFLLDRDGKKKRVLALASRRVCH